MRGVRCEVLRERRSDELENRTVRQLRIGNRGLGIGEFDRWVGESKRETGTIWTCRIGSRWWVVLTLRKVGDGG